MIVITESNGIFSSPRIEKYINFCKEKKIEYLVVGWDRNDEKLKRDKTIYFEKKSGYNIGGKKAAFHRIGWMFFLLKILMKNRGQITAIHACDLDTAFPACVFKMFLKRNVIVIFDIFDWFSATLYNQHKFILWIFKKMERYSINHSDEVVICEPERIEQIPYKLNKKELILPNIPSFLSSDFLYKSTEYKFNDAKIVFSYVGGFGTERFLNELLDVAEKGLISLLIAGFGNREFEERCLKLSTLPNIKYFGKVVYETGLNIMFNSDIIYAMYCKTNPNNIYAAPNKYYEAMMLGKPILTTKGISISNKIVTQNIGYVIEESVSELEDLINLLQKNDMLKKGTNAYHLWEMKYKTYIGDFLQDTYMKIIINTDQ